VKQTGKQIPNQLRRRFFQFNVEHFLVIFFRFLFLCWFFVILKRIVRWRGWSQIDQPTSFASCRSNGQMVDTRNRRRNSVAATFEPAVLLPHCHGWRIIVGKWKSVFFLFRRQLRQTERLDQKFVPKVEDLALLFVRQLVVDCVLRWKVARLIDDRNYLVGVILKKYINNKLKKITKSCCTFWKKF